MNAIERVGFLPDPGVQPPESDPFSGELVVVHLARAKEVHGAPGHEEDRARHARRSMAVSSDGTTSSGKSNDKVIMAKHSRDPQKATVSAYDRKAEMSGKRANP